MVALTPQLPFWCYFKKRLSIIIPNTDAKGYLQHWHKTQKGKNTSGTQHMKKSPSAVYFINTEDIFQS